MNVLYQRNKLHRTFCREKNKQTHKTKEKRVKQQNKMIHNQKKTHTQISNFVDFSFLLIFLKHFSTEYDDTIKNL